MIYCHDCAGECTGVWADPLNRPLCAKCARLTKGAIRKPGRVKRSVELPKLIPERFTYIPKGVEYAGLRLVAEKHIGKGR